MPLAEFLVPQLYRKAQEIEDQIGPAVGAPLATGYLEAGYEKTPYDPNGSVDKPKGRTYDPNSRLGNVLAPLGRMQRSGDPNQEAFARGMAQGLQDNMVKPAPGAPQQRELPTSPAAPTRFLKGAPRNPRVIPAQTGAAGVNERGESVDVRGRVVSKGYLDQPALVTRDGEAPLRAPNRTANDVMAVDKDPFAIEALRQRYGKHLKAMQENRDDEGKPTDAFPDGYFKGMSKAQKQGIIDGVKELQKREREMGTGPGDGISI